LKLSLFQAWSPARRLEQGEKINHHLSIQSFPLLAAVLAARLVVLHVAAAAHDEAGVFLGLHCAIPA